MSNRKWIECFLGQPMDRSRFEEMFGEATKFKATVTGRLTDETEEFSRAIHDIQKAGISAAESVRAFGEAAQSLPEIDYAAIERRIFGIMAGGEPFAGGLLNPEDLLGKGGWRYVGRQRARKLRRRGVWVERTAEGWRWWRHLDPVKEFAADLFGIPYAQVQPRHRKAAKTIAFMQSVRRVT